MTVSGWTMARAERQSLQTRDRMSHNRRSAGVSFGRCFTERFKTLTWWRRARFSISTAARERKADRKRVIKIGRTRIETELRGGGNLHHLREIGISDRHKYARRSGGAGALTFHIGSLSGSMPGPSRPCRSASRIVGLPSTGTPLPTPLSGIPGFRNSGPSNTGQAPSAPPSPALPGILPAPVAGTRTAHLA